MDRLVGGTCTAHSSGEHKPFIHDGDHPITANSNMCIDESRDTTTTGIHDGGDVAHDCEITDHYDSIATSNNGDATPLIADICTDCATRIDTNTEKQHDDTPSHVCLVTPHGGSKDASAAAATLLPSLTLSNSACTTTVYPSLCDYHPVIKTELEDRETIFKHYHHCIHSHDCRHHNHHVVVVGEEDWDMVASEPWDHVLTDPRFDYMCLPLYDQNVLDHVPTGVVCPLYQTLCTLALLPPSSSDSRMSCPGNINVASSATHHDEHTLRNNTDAIANSTSCTTSCYYCCCASHSNPKMDNLLHHHGSDGKCDSTTIGTTTTCHHPLDDASHTIHPVLSDREDVSMTESNVDTVIPMVNSVQTAIRHPTVTTCPIIPLMMMIPSSSTQSPSVEPFTMPQSPTTFSVMPSCTNNHSRDRISDMTIPTIAVSTTTIPLTPFSVATIASHSELQQQQQFTLLVDPGTIPLHHSIILNRTETHHAIVIGQRRNEANRQNKSKSALYCKMDDEDASILGVLGEYAFCKMFGLPLEVYDTTCRNYLNDTFDCTFPGNIKCDIKTSMEHQRALVLPEYKAQHCPMIYALMIYVNADYGMRIRDRVYNTDHLPELSFRGFATSADLIAHENMRLRRDHRIYYILPQSKLKTWNELKW